MLKQFSHLAAFAVVAVLATAPAHATEFLKAIDDVPLQPLLDAYPAWVDKTRRRIGEEARSERRAACAEALFSAALRCHARIQEGIALLRSDATALLAFQLTQQAMAEATCATASSSPISPSSSWLTLTSFMPS